MRIQAKDILAQFDDPSDVEVFSVLIDEEPEDIFRRMNELTAALQQQGLENVSIKLDDGRYKLVFDTEGEAQTAYNILANEGLNVNLNGISVDHEHREMMEDQLMSIPVRAKMTKQLREAFDASDKKAHVTKRAVLQLRPIGSNMTEVETDAVTVLFSYSTPVAYEDKTTGKLYRTDERFSVTTSKHINKWLEGREAETVPQAQIEGLVQTAAIEETLEDCALIQEIKNKEEVDKPRGEIPKAAQFVEEEEEDEPQEDDAFIETKFNSFNVSFGGKFLGEVTEYEEAERLIKEAAAGGNFWPNVWQVSDHGNFHLIENFWNDEDF